MSTTKNPLLFKALYLTILITIAFSLRLYYINHTVVDEPIRADAGEYYAYAVNMQKHGVYSRTWPSNIIIKPDALRSPGYPFFLSALVDWPPTVATIYTVSFWQALLDTLTVLLTYFLACYFMTNRLAICAALLVAISPHLISLTSYLLSETLFSFIITASVLSIVIAIKRNSHLAFLLAGILLALASLTRPTVQYFILLLIVSLIFTSKSVLNKRVLWSFILGFCLIFSVWVIRNIWILGMASGHTLSISTLHHGIYPDFMYQAIPQTLGVPYRYDPNSPDISSSLSSVINEIIRRFEYQPINHLKWYLLNKPITLFSWNIIAGIGDVFVYPIIKSPYFDQPMYIKLHQIMYYLHWPLIILSLCAVSLVWLWRKILYMSDSRLVAIRVLSLLILYILMIHMLGSPFPRYSIPFRPISYILALWLFGWLIKFVRTIRRK